MMAIAGGVTAPKGYRAAGVAVGIKPNSAKLDCALVVSDVPSIVAGVFTTNVMKAPCIAWNQQVCARGMAQAAFINSGNANAATGDRGVADVKATAALVAAGLNLAPDRVCVCSTGVIGVPLPMDRIGNGVRGCLESLSPTGGGDAARAIMTTDLVPKERAVEMPLSWGKARLGAIAKGSGMIAPNMATMICVITTDVSVAAGPLRDALRKAVDASFNRICVDNDMSTSDAVLCFANGQAGGGALAPGTEDYETFSAALTGLCRDLAQDLVRDGEGATKFVEIAVSGADTNENAQKTARAIATSALCKTAFFGQDPNWGRIACAAGYSGVAFDPAKLSIWIEDIQLMRDGAAAAFVEAEAAACMQRPAFRIRVSLGDGPGEATYWTCDLSHDYVAINADYRT